MHPSTSAKQRERQALKAAGWSHHELWLNPQEQEWLQALRSVGESFRDTIGRALELAIHARQHPSRHATSKVTSQYLEQRQENMSAAVASHLPRTWDREAILGRLTDLYAEHHSYEKVAQQLNAEGVPTVSGRGRWDRGTVRSRLRSMRQDRD
jgi:Recombinase